jgi:gluconokinase
MQYVIGVDIGTTSTKAIAFSTEGLVLAKKTREYPILSPYPNWSEQVPDTIFDAVINSIKHVVTECTIEGNTLAGVSFSSAMHSVIAVDENGLNLTDCIIWADTRSNEYALKLRNSEIGHKIYMRTGTPIHPMSPLCKLLWMKDNAAELFRHAFKFISIKEYVFNKLFERYVIDYSLASATGLFDIYSLQWNDESLSLIGITSERLSEPVSPETVLEGIVQKYADYMGLDRNTPFVVGGSDGCLANLGVNAINAGNAAVTIGTSGAIRVIAKEPKNDDKERIFSYILTEDHYVLGGPVNNGGIIFRWFRDNFSPLELQEAEKSGIDPYELLTEKAAHISAGADNLIFLPYLLGERAPHWDADSRGVFFGINMKHTRDHFLRALLEGVIYGIYSVSKALQETAGNIDVIYATGGFVRSELWVQILADVFGKEVRIAESYESSCLGAAVIGMKALGHISKIEEVERLVPVSKVFMPNQKNHKEYMRIHEIYERLYWKLKDEFACLGT